jgi:hypothetical protein
MQVKTDVRQPLTFATVLAILLGYRLMVYWRRPKSTQAATPVVKPKLEAYTGSRK